MGGFSSGIGRGNLILMIVESSALEPSGCKISLICVDKKQKQKKLSIS